MKQFFSYFFAGLLFGIGLALSNMIDPNKVVDFLDVTGNWDPSLAFVMIAALSISFIAFNLIPKKASPIFDDKFKLPTRKDIDKPLIVGASIFGIGWGIAGFCPGPALSSLTTGLLDPVIFVLSMLSGFLVHHYLFDV
jgi:hypothetical protein